MSVPNEQEVVVMGEKLSPQDSPTAAGNVTPPEKKKWAPLRTFLRKAAVFGRVELRGIAPIPIKERTVTRTINVFTLWWSMSVNILPITFGMLGPIYGLCLRDSSLVILFFTLLTTLLPAYLSTLGPKIGMRQMVQARYSFGRYLVSIPVLLNLATLTGFSIIIAVVGGQCLSAVAGGGGNVLSVNVGIVIIALLSLVISFCGYRVLHVYERFAWIPALIAIIVAVGTGGEGLRQQTAPEEAVTAPAVLSFGMIVSSYMIPWACLASDFTTYLVPTTSSNKIFWYSYLGLGLPTILLMILGAAIGGAVTNVPSWSAGYESNLAGGVLAAMLEPAGGFGKFLVVILSFTLLGNLAASSYSVTLNFQLLAPGMVRVPRYVFALILTAIVIPLSIRAAVDFFLNLENVIALIGYWSSAFLGVVMVEHLYFRRGDCESYDPDAWDTASLLPLGVGALAASALSFGLVIPSMDQTWYHGPFAKTTGDIGFELAFVVTAVLYIPLRHLEKRLSGR
ncbi:permease for cytosine/purines, uracil, thiamine, allantoin-domain-containing protein [Podospora didyma]|uniref:Permease for cytosine/purines, uracil, thiamine, allantoin-domain-containing protein n=1 Tax=Podospora didyma TaxID=330526 RepID=A0AAE0KKK8_9PEZI|nr:permease for cytosine/purines, uracil, thiamine, allantoin-domain-containing protein [Podospora didyma]